VTESHEPTHSTPKGLDIPVPKREDVERDPKKLIEPGHSAKPKDAHDVYGNTWIDNS
jgi:hypothetical protein